MGSAASPVGLSTRPALMQFHLDQTDAGPLSLPSDVEIGRHGQVWVVDSGNHRLVVFDRDGAFLFSAGGAGKGRGQMQAPLGLGIDRDGSVYVADADNFRIQVFSPDGEFNTSIALRDKNGPIRPADVAVGKGGALFVTGNNRHKVFKLDSRGRLISSWGSEGVSQGEFRYPATIAVRNGLVYVVDVLNTRIQIFDEDGTFQYQLGEWGVKAGQLFRPKGIAVADKGQVYVSDSYMDLVQVYDNGYAFDHIIGNQSGIQQFTAPTGVAIDSSGRLYVCEMLAHRISVLQLNQRWQEP